MANGEAGGRDVPAARRSSRPYSPAWNLIPIAAGVLDPLYGILTHVWEIFWHPRVPERADTPARRKRGLTLVLGGIEGPGPYNYWMCMGVLRAGWRGAVKRFAWNRGIPLLRSARNLMSSAHHERQADALAAAIVAHKWQHPDAPVNLIAQSGGCWIVVRALERLPESVRAGTAVLLAPSISPGYDPAKAAAKCDGGLISVGGPGDFFFLGLGTVVFGTSDRVHTPSSGWVGWHHRPTGFTESRWHPDWAKRGFLGNHTSSSQMRFIRDIIAPLLR